MAQPVPVPNIEFTLRQVATLNGVIGELHDRLPVDRGLESGGCKDENANLSICTSLIHACSRLDALLQDDSRWALKTDTHETLLQIAQMDREIMKSRVLSENLGRTITKLQVFGYQQGPEVPDVRATPPTKDAEVVPEPKVAKAKTKRKK